jgi:hypothetical protein
MQAFWAQRVVLNADGSVRENFFAQFPSHRPKGDSNRPDRGSTAQGYSRWRQPLEAWWRAQRVPRRAR